MKQQIHDTILSGINLIHGDCLVEMKNIPDQSIDMILCGDRKSTSYAEVSALAPLPDRVVHRP